LAHRTTWAVAVDENDAAQNASIIDALATIALGEVRLKTSHLPSSAPSEQNLE